MKYPQYFLYSAWLLLVLSCDSGQPTQVAREAPADENTRRKDPEGLNFDKQAAADSLARWVDSTSLGVALPGIDPDEVVQQLNTFYAGRAFAPAWGIGTAESLLDFIQNLDQEGLSPGSYPVDTLRALLERSRQSGASPADGARLDLLLSATYLKMADQLAMGKIKPEQLSDSWHIRPQAPDSLHTYLQKAVDGAVAASLGSLRPHFGQYNKLRKHLQTYQKLLDEGGWPTVEPGPELAPGDSSERITNTRQRLYLTGDLAVAPAQTAQPNRYDSSLIQAVNRYQQRNGLVVQPEINDRMVEAMNVPVAYRLRQLKLNLDRIRWLSTGPMPETYVLVNIPEYRLHVVENGQEIKLMKVIVGKTMNSTPIFSDMIEHVEFSPYWNVPNSIARNELWPKIRRSSSYLRRNHFEILDGWGANARPVSRSSVNWNRLNNYRIRQKPGPWNALGQVKFMFPNQYAIYLHDTPAGYLFEKNYRAFSHGCIRIGEPAWFADWLFPQFDQEEVEEKMNNRQHEYVKLEQKIPVYIFYLTAFEDNAGRVNFRPDLYGLDEKLGAAFESTD